MKTPKNQMSKELASELFVFTGDRLYWRNSRGSINPTRPAGSINHGRYRRLGYKGKRYQVHNVIWNLHYGIIPDGYTVDHIDRDSLNNKLSNLRLATAIEQNANRSEHKMQTNNTSGHKGVHLYKRTQKWHARLFANGQAIHLGFFDKLEDAVECRNRELSKARR